MKPLAPAHPIIADALVAAGRNVADTIEPAYRATADRALRWVFWTLMAVSSVAIYAARAWGLL